MKLIKRFRWAIPAFFMQMYVVLVPFFALGEVTNFQYGGQGLILVVSDSVLGSWSEMLQQIPILGRPSLYKYDRVTVVLGSEIIESDALRRTAAQMARDMKAIDVFVFSHGSGGSLSLRRQYPDGVNGSMDGTLFASDLAKMLQPLRGKFRLFYTSACGFAEATRYLVAPGLAKVGVSHYYNGLNVTPLTFPLKFLRYFKADNMSAFDAATRAWHYVLANPNPLMAAAQSILFHFVDSGQSQPEIFGDSKVKGSDIDLSSLPDRLLMDAVLIR